ncbi:MAG: pilus assembly PilX N-terminal domain-containing protein [Deltaproteobacteria bacterium]|nr:pilus assembly PilX N-terminal domain-containing protein [Deltaproteobacteria bacterium]
MIRAKLRDNQGITLVVVLMTMAILLSVISAGLLFSGVNTKITSNYQQGTRAFYAADAGLGEAVSIVSANQAAVEAITISRDINGDGKLKYRGGGRTTPGPVAQFVGNRTGTGDSLSSGLSGYNESNGYVYYQYQLVVTGTYEAAGTELAGRSLQAQAIFGPISN